MSAQNTGPTSVEKPEFDESAHNSKMFDNSTNFDETIDNNVSTNLFDKSIQHNESSAMVNGENTDRILTSSPLPHGKPLSSEGFVFQPPVIFTIKFASQDSKYLKTYVYILL
jgi:hypothetical protein